ILLKKRSDIFILETILIEKIITIKGIILEAKFLSYKRMIFVTAAFVSKFENTKKLLIQKQVNHIKG
ncbi:MAG: hypothetical protein ABI366_00870, partial [Ginsengibacter sp.]